MGMGTRTIALVSMIGVLSSTVGLAKAQEFSDVSADFTTLNESFIRDGTFIPVPDVRNVEQGQNLSKEETQGILGSPNEAGSTFEDNNWLYNINLPLSESDYLVCQYRVSFQQNVVVNTDWRRPQCEQRYRELSEPQEYTLSADLLFGFDSASISAEGNEAIRQIANEIREYFEDPSITILGYTDRIGSQDYNMQLSERRAEAVATSLINSGADPRWIEYEGRGSSDPVVGCEGAVGNELISCLSPNRRVYISLYEQR
ncbi:OmpA family protein [Halomonas sp. SpR8]|uniref:OmpA family protein n=1 Tax=Halomonas sp. SpR8 TaxID=3050463 RepID=UPI0027E57FD9|nr:OmpA family protein [Halomonas sp. SpR8]MDQ7730794.1 OmpA family protein [Halomonas sp. SpR8]